MSENENTAIKNTIRDLVTTYGEVNIRAAAEQMLAASVRPIPAEYIPIISPDKLGDSVAAIEAAITDVLAAGQQKEALFEEKGPLLRRKFQLETSIELTESEAMMKIQGEGKTAYVQIGSEKVYITNEETRKAYRRQAAKTEREELAKVDGDLNALELKVIIATDDWERAKKAADLVERRAFVQGNLLNFLAGR